MYDIKPAKVYISHNDIRKYLGSDDNDSLELESQGRKRSPGTEICPVFFQRVEKYARRKLDTANERRSLGNMVRRWLRRRIPGSTDSRHSPRNGIFGIYPYSVNGDYGGKVLQSL